jgi:hypothetical protein
MLARYHTPDNGVNFSLFLRQVAQPILRRRNDTWEVIEGNVSYTVVAIS